jgi:hypothetical protein
MNLRVLQSTHERGTELVALSAKQSFKWMLQYNAFRRVTLAVGPSSETSQTE